MSNFKISEMAKMSSRIFHGSVGLLKITELLQSENSDYFEYLMRLLKLEEDVCTQVNEYFVEMYNKERTIEDLMRQALEELPLGKSSQGYSIKDGMTVLDEEYLEREFERNEYEGVLEGLSSFIMLFNSSSEIKMSYISSGRKIEIEAMVSGLNCLPVEMQYSTMVRCINKWRSEIHKKNVIYYVRFCERNVKEWSNPSVDPCVKRCVWREIDGEPRLELNNKYLVKKLGEPDMDLKTIIEYHHEVIALASDINGYGDRDRKIKLSDDEMRFMKYR